MQYKVIIESCKDPARAQEIALEMARYSGFQATTIYDALLEKLVCVKSNADERDAKALKERFEKAGASVRLETVGVSSAQAGNGYDDDEEDAPGRILSNEEYIEQLKNRGDIFYIEKNTRLKRIEAVCLMVAICVGVWLSTTSAIIIPPDFVSELKVFEDVSIIRMSKKIVDVNDYKKEVKREQIQSERRKLKPTNSQGSAKNGSGGGDPRGRVTRKGFLSYISDGIDGKHVATAGISGLGGFTKGIDNILDGLGGLTSCKNSGTGRRGPAALGNGIGFNSGIGSGSGDFDIDNFMNVGPEKVTLDRQKEARILIPTDVDIKGPNGKRFEQTGRNKASIMRVVMQNLSALRYAYNKRLREKPGLKGRITCKFAIDEYGKVLFCRVESSSMNDPVLEKEIVSKIRRWVFEKIDKPGDVTEVVYPFVFTS